MQRGAQEVLPVIGDGSDYVSFEIKAEEDEGGLRKDFRIGFTLNASSFSRTDEPGPSPLSSIAPIDESSRDESCITGLLVAELKRLDNQARLITERIEEAIHIENRDERELIEILKSRGYEPDPVIMWKRRYVTGFQWDGIEHEEENEFVEQPPDDFDLYEYIINMPLWSLTQEGLDVLTKEIVERENQLVSLRQMSFENTNVDDLEAYFWRLLRSHGSHGTRDSRQAAGGTSIGISEAMPSASASSAVPNVGESHRFRNVATSDDQRPRVVNERAPDYSGRAVAATERQRDPPTTSNHNRRKRLPTRLHSWRCCNPYPHQGLSVLLKGLESTREAQSHRNPPAASSRQDRGDPSTATYSQRETSGRDGSNPQRRVR
ncbi:hypothetical protein HPB50_003111 [Hyalomma asiaticum]|uniref:Uncharacterized protein n=1 Tax=Hyalomma asiaticum TaxID=266040 RepID=A0ACB7THW8_HYAAI|nr:hypothetical protein HPB50_003111 [Hyalomma asiaticum]